MLKSTSIVEELMSWFLIGLILFSYGVYWWFKRGIDADFNGFRKKFLKLIGLTFLVILLINLVKVAIYYFN